MFKPSLTLHSKGPRSAESQRNDAGHITIGGPICIPGVFNKEKNKLFFVDG